MFGFSYLKIGIAAAVAGALLFAFLQYSAMKKDLKTSEANVAKLEISLSVQSDTIEAQSKAIDKWEQKLKDVTETAKKLKEVREGATAESRRLNDIFRRHDMQALSLAKPDTLERLINAGTADVLRLFERETATDNDSTD